MKVKSYNPSKNYELNGEIESSSLDQIKKKVSESREVSEKWANLSLDNRKELINSFLKIVKKNISDLTKLTAQEMGMLFEEAQEDLAYSLDYMQGYMKQADTYLSPEVVFNDQQLYQEVARRIKTGMVSQNGISYSRDTNPFGGYKKSGLGRTHGKYGFHDVTQVKITTREK